MEQWLQSRVMKKIYMIGIFFSDVSEIKSPLVDHFEKRTLCFVTKLLELLFSPNLWIGIGVESDTMSDMINSVISELFLFVKSLQRSSFSPKLGNSHLIHRQGTSLISTDIIGATHSLTRS